MLWHLAREPTLSPAVSTTRQGKRDMVPKEKGVVGSGRLSATTRLAEVADPESEVPVPTLKTYKLKRQV